MFACYGIWDCVCISSEIWPCPLWACELYFKTFRNYCYCSYIYPTTGDHQQSHAYNSHPSVYYSKPGDLVLSNQVLMEWIDNLLINSYLWRASLSQVLRQQWFRSGVSNPAISNNINVILNILAEWEFRGSRLCSSQFRNIYFSPSPSFNITRKWGLDVSGIWFCQIF